MLAHWAHKSITVPVERIESKELEKTKRQGSDPLPFIVLIKKNCFVLQVFGNSQLV